VASVSFDALCDPCMRVRGMHAVCQPVAAVRVCRCENLFVAIFARRAHETASAGSFAQIGGSRLVAISHARERAGSVGHSEVSGAERYVMTS
jgi:hypothetical protein